MHKWTYDEILNKVKKLIEEYGEFPSRKKIRELGLTSLMSAIDRICGMKQIYKALGISPKRKGDWTDEKVFEEMKNIIDKLGYCPTQKELMSMQRSDLVTQIVRRGLWNEIHSRFSIKQKSKPWGYWTEDKYIEEMELIYKEMQRLPSKEELLKMERRDLLYPIGKFGMQLVYRKLDIVPKQKKDYWSFEKVIEEVSELMDMLGEMPTLQTIRELGRYDLSSAILRYTNMTQLSEALNQKARKKNNYWDNSKIEQEIKKYLVSNNGKFPTLNDLKNCQRFDLVSAINKSGGFRFWRDELGYDQHSNPYGFYKDFNNIESVINEFKIKYKKFPTISELNEFKPGIKAGIKHYYGGYRNIRTMLNEPQLAHEKSYWKDINNIKLAIDDLKKNIGRIPGCDDLNRYGEKGLYAAIAIYHGGLVELYEKLGLDYVSNTSKFESRVKFLLTREIDCDIYLDNGRKKLYTRYQIILKNPENGCWLELDRYYPEYKIAIEVQGDQHSKEVDFFAKQLGIPAGEYLKKIQKRDEEKLKQCSEQGIKIIYIDTSMDDDMIIELVEQYIPRRENPLDIVYEDNSYTIEKMKDIFGTLYEENGKVTSNMVKEYSSVLYREVMRKFNSIPNARSFLLGNDME